MSKRVCITVADEDLARYEMCAARSGADVATWMRTQLVSAANRQLVRRKKTPRERMIAIKRAMAIPEEGRVSVGSVDQMKADYARRYDDCPGAR